MVHVCVSRIDWVEYFTALGNISMRRKNGTVWAHEGYLYPHNWKWAIPTPQVGSGRGTGWPYFVKSPLGILQNIVNPYLDPTRPEGLELLTLGYGGEGIPRVLKQYRFFSAWIYFPMRWSNRLNEPQRRISASGSSLVSARRQAIARTDCDLSSCAPLGTKCSELCILNINSFIKSPRSGVTLCFQSVSAASASAASAASAAAKTFPSHVKTVWAKPLIFGTKNIWVWGIVLDDLSMTLTQGHGCGIH